MKSEVAELSRATAVLTATTSSKAVARSEMFRQAADLAAALSGAARVRRFGHFPMRFIRARYRAARRNVCDREPPFIPYWMRRHHHFADEWDDLRPLHPHRFRRRGPMDRFELYRWHLARGALRKFDRMFPTRR